MSIWHDADYLIPIDGPFAESAYRCTCRTDFDSPGFALIDLGTSATSESLRRTMADLKAEMSRIHRARRGAGLAFLSAARFDQQETTRPHRDGGRDECFLMLGYEPTPVAAELTLFDYSRCAAEMGITPAEFLTKHNPMFRTGEDLLAPFATPVEGFSHERFQIVLINNSVAERPGWQGVLHTAKMLNPSPEFRRVVNSTMVAPWPDGEPEPVSAAALDEFLTTTRVNRRGNDKPDLDET